MKPVTRRVRATLDVEAAFVYCHDAGGMELALGFLDEVERVLDHIAEHPGTGSSRYAGQFQGLALRFWLLNRFPYAAFYVARNHHIELLRLLHQAADLPVHLKDTE